MSNEIHVEIVYGTPESQKIVSITVEKGATAQQAAAASGITKIYPEIDLNIVSMGIFGNALGVRGLPDASKYELKEADRVEIYRPLIADPKEVRKKRATEAAERRASKKS